MWHLEAFLVGALTVICTNICLKYLFRLRRLLVKTKRRLLLLLISFRVKFKNFCNSSEIPCFQIKYSTFAKSTLYCVIWRLLRLLTTYYVNLFKKKHLSTVKGNLNKLDSGEAFSLFSILIISFPSYIKS